MSGYQKPQNLDDLFVQMKEDNPNLPTWDNLPIFSNRPIEHTIKVWSWDDTRMIVGTCAEDLMIVPRED